MDTVEEYDQRNMMIKLYESHKQILLDSMNGDIERLVLFIGVFLLCDNPWKGLLFGGVCFVGWLAQRFVKQGLEE